VFSYCLKNNEITKEKMFCFVQYLALPNLGLEIKNISINFEISIFIIIYFIPINILKFILLRIYLSKIFLDSKRSE